MNQVLIYEFLLEAVTPLYFGNGEVGMLTGDDTIRKPYLFGNAIGGALKDYLRRTNIDENLIEQFMGNDIADLEKPGRRKFIPSLLYISDGRIRAPGLLKREGTAIDPKRGTAEQHKKYELLCFPEGTKIRFSIECNEWTKENEEDRQLTPENLEKLIGTWARGFGSGQLLLGGHKNNGCGKVNLVRLRCRRFRFESAEDIDRYLFRPHFEPLQKMDLNKLNYWELRENCKLVFTMKGTFPYGVYQHYASESVDDRSVSGLQSRNRDGKRGGQSSYYLPASSVKGVVKHEIRQLLQRIHQDDGKVEEKLALLFGGEDQKGKLRFEDLWIEKHQEVRINRPQKRDEETRGHNPLPVYVKIDRLTGGAFDAALKTQREIQGEAEIRVELETNTEQEIECFRFPIIYALRRIGSGQTPLGGRTVIGLGLFFAEELQIEVPGNKQITLSTGELSPSEREGLKKDYDTFIGWCKCEREQEQTVYMGDVCGGNG